MESEQQKQGKLTHSQAVLYYVFLIIALFVLGLRLYGAIAKTDDLADTRFFGSKMLGVILIAGMTVFHRWTDMKLNWSSVRGTKEDNMQSLKIGLIISALVIVLFIVFRLIMTAKNPSIKEIPWFGLYLNMNTRWLYPVSILFQEIFIKCFVQDNFCRFFGDNYIHLPILITSLFFFILHLQYPLYYMTGAFALCMITGYIYRKYPSVIAPYLIHFAIGFLPRCLGILQIIE